MTDNKPRSSGTEVRDAVKRLTPIQQKALFWVGLTLVVTPITLTVLIYSGVIVHPGDHGPFQTLAEIGAAVTSMTFGICLAVPPLGMWLVNKLPLPKFLKRGNSP